MDRFSEYDRKRRIYFAASLVSVMLVGADYAWSVLQLPFINRFGGGDVKTAVVLCYTVSVLAGNICPIIFSPFISRLGLRRTLLASALIMASGYIIGCNVGSMLLFYVFFGLFKGGGGGLIYVTLMAYISNLFPDKRGTATGIMAGAYGGASMIWAVLLAYFIERFSLEAACTGLGILMFIVYIPILLIIRTVPDDYTEHKRSGAVSSAKAVSSVMPELSRGEMLRRGMFYAAFGAFSLGCSSGLMVMTQTSTIMQQGFMYTAARGSLCASAMSLMNMTGRFFWGAVTDHFDKCAVIRVLCAVSAAAMLVASASGGPAVTLACLAASAFCYGGYGGTINTLTAYLFGAEHLTANYSVMNMAFGVGSIIAAQLAVRFAVGGNYRPAFLAACSLASVAVVLTLFVSFKVRRMSAYEDRTEHALR